MADHSDISFTVKDIIYQSYLECRANKGFKALRPWLVRYFVVEGKHFTIRRYKDTTKAAEADSRVYFLEDLKHIMLIDKEGTRFTLRFKRGRSTMHTLHDNHKDYMDVKFAAESFEVRQQWVTALSIAVRTQREQKQAEMNTASISTAEAVSGGAADRHSLVLDSDTAAKLLEHEREEEARQEKAAGAGTQRRGLFGARGKKKTAAAPAPVADAVEAEEEITPEDDNLPTGNVPSATIPAAHETTTAESAPIETPVAQSSAVAAVENTLVEPPVAHEPLSSSDAVGLEDALSDAASEALTEAENAAAGYEEVDGTTADGDEWTYDADAANHVTDSSQAVEEQSYVEYEDDVAPSGAAAIAAVRDAAPEQLQFDEGGSRVDANAAADGEYEYAENADAEGQGEFTPEELEALRKEWRRKAWRIMAFITTFLKILERTSSRKLSVAEKRARLLKNMRHDVVKHVQGKEEKLRAFLAVDELNVPTV